MAEPINTWDHVIPEGLGEFDGLSWTKLSRIFGDDFERWFMTAYGLLVLDERGHLTKVTGERVGARLWVFAHCVEELGDLLPSIPMQKFGDKQRENFEAFRDFIRTCMGQAHPLGLLEIFYERGTCSLGLRSSAERRGELKRIGESMTWYVLVPEWERWFAVVQADRRGEAGLYGGAAA